MSLSRDGVALSRRGFVKTAGASALMLAAGAVINRPEAWGLEAKALRPETLRSLIVMARDIYPHDRLADRYYALAIKGYDAAAAEDEAVAQLIEGGVAELDAAAEAAHGRPYAELAWEAERVSVLRGLQDRPLFQKLRGDLVTGLYNNPEVWPLFGYEGESASKGGYLDRGFDDLDWL